MAASEDFASEAYSVTSLFKTSLQSVVTNLNDNLHVIQGFPPSVKDRILYLMCKRGLVTDQNIDKVLHNKVRVLDLSESEVADQSLQLIAKRCPELCKIDLNSNKGQRTSVTATGIQALHQCRHLQAVYLRRCVRVTDDAIVSLSANCRQLRDLNLGCCHQITDSSLKALGQNSHFLRSLDISTARVTDEGILSLVSGPCGQTLKELHINHCELLTDETVEAATHYCKQLVNFIFHGCPNITEDSRIALEEMSLLQNRQMKQITWTIY